jgi:hypothetical protein
MATSTPRPIRIEGNIAYVPLTNGHEAVISAQDAHLVEGVSWSISRSKHTLYARRTAPRSQGKKTILMHRVITDAKAEFDVDHIDRNGLNNRRENLRVATKSQNACNRAPKPGTASGFKGVFFHKISGQWRACITVNRRKRHLGLFDTPLEAHEAYCREAAKAHGEFARPG